MSMLLDQARLRPQLLLMLPSLLSQDFRDHLVHAARAGRLLGVQPAGPPITCERSEEKNLCLGGSSACGRLEPHSRANHSTQRAAARGGRSP